MLKIHQLFLRAYLWIFLTILLIIAISAYFWLQTLLIKQTENNLIQNINTLSIIIQEDFKLNYIKKIVQKLHKELNLRITIIDEKGYVIIESNENAIIQDNHINRPEIIEASNNTWGKSNRISSSTKKELIYIAKKIKIAQNIYYIRMADYEEKALESFINLACKIFLYTLVFLAISFITSYVISLKIKNETDKILYYLTQLGKNKNLPLIKSNYTYEFYRISKLLNKVASKLNKKDAKNLKQNAKLKLINKQKDDIISAISHEFKNPISVISGYSESILNDKNIPEEIKNKFLNKIYSNSNKLSKIIDKLRLVLKLEKQKEELVLANYSIKKIVTNCIDDLEEKYKNRKILIYGNDYIIKADETLFNIAISNIIENALKYSKDEIKIEIQKKYICIIDKGIGIEQNELEKINKKFYRVSKNGWDNSLGLGLFIVQSILKMHNFRLEIQSKIKKGSKFYIKY